MKAALEGVLVVDLSRHLPGPFAARMLANLGARVIKVEEPVVGDPVRAAPPFLSGRSLLAESLLAGVESVALDLKREGGQAVLRSLLEQADVLLETFRPGTLARFGLAPEALREELPRLVICSISGWGQGGPTANRSGHDLTYQAAAGALAASGRTPPLPSADLLGAWSAVAAINAALFARARGAGGTWIDASLFDAAVVGNVTNIVEDAAGRKDGDGRLPFPGPLTGAIPCYRVYRSSDGKLVALAALEAKFWRALCQAVGREDLVAVQYRRDPDSHRRVAELIAGRTAGEWQAIFSAEDLPGEIVAGPSEALAAEQTVARGLSGAGRGGTPFPALMGGTRPSGGSRLPRLGEQTRSVVAEFCPRWLEGSRRARVAAGVGPRLSLKRAVQGWVGNLRR